MGEVKKTRRQKVLLVSFFVMSNWHLLNQELINLYRSRGDRIHLLKAGHFRAPRVRDFKITDVEIVRLPISRAINLLDSEELTKSLESEMHTLFRTPSPSGLLYRWVHALYMSRAREFALRFSSLIESEKYDAVLIPNGRAGIPSLAAKIAARKGAKVLFLETSSGYRTKKGRYFLEEFRIHDREERQHKLMRLMEHGQHVTEYFQDWLNGRMRPNSETNRFGKEWNFEERLGDQWRDFNLFLNSSTDEFWSVRQEWSLDEWEDQYEAFAFAISKLKQMGESKFVLRLHPNLQNKDPSFAKHELRRVETLKQRFPELIVVSPLSNLNTYELIRNAKRVFVTLSTSGLEASGLGKPVWCVNPTTYDMIADVRRLWKRAELTDRNLEIYPVDAGLAHSFLFASSKEGPRYVAPFKKWNEDRTKRFFAMANLDLPLRMIIWSERQIANFRTKLILRKLPSLIGQKTRDS